MDAVRVLSAGRNGQRALVYPARAIPPLELERWLQLYEERESDASPFLHPEYVRAVSGVRGGVEVCVMMGEDGSPAGFLPVQRSSFGVGGPVGGRLCDHSGALVAAGFDWSPSVVARAARLRALRFRHVPMALAPAAALDGCHVEAAPFLDLSGGFDHYRTLTRRSGSSLLRQLDRRGRKIEREIGPLRFEWHTPDDRVLQTLLAWKGRQRLATKTPNVLRLPWARALVDVLRRSDSHGFAGVLSALYAGDSLVAAHFGIRTRRTLHYWIPAYSEAHAHYSPGLLALLAIAREAAERGVRRVDLGVGDERYKGRAATSDRPVVTATLSAGGAVGSLSAAAAGLRAWARTSSVDPLVRGATRAILRACYTVRAMASRS